MWSSLHHYRRVQWMHILLIAISCTTCTLWVVYNIFTLTYGVINFPVWVRKRYGSVFSGIIVAYVFRSISNGAGILTGQTLPDLASLCSKTCNKKANSIKDIRYSCVFMSKGMSVFIYFVKSCTYFYFNIPSVCALCLHYSLLSQMCHVTSSLNIC